MLIVVLLLLSILFIVISTTRFNLHAFLALIIAALFFGVCSRMPLQEIASSIEQGFGGTIGKDRHRDYRGGHHRCISGQIRRRLRPGRTNLEGHREEERDTCHGTDRLYRLHSLYLRIPVL